MICVNVFVFMMTFIVLRLNCLVGGQSQMMEDKFYILAHVICNLRVFGARSRV
jgi:hypothetical protein